MTSTCIWCAKAENSHRLCIKCAPCFVNKLYDPRQCSHCVNLFEECTSDDNNLNSEARKNLDEWTKSIIRYKQRHSKSSSDDIKAFWFSEDAKEAYRGNFVSNIFSLPVGNVITNKRGRDLNQSLLNTSEENNRKRSKNHSSPEDSRSDSSVVFDEQEIPCIPNRSESSTSNIPLDNQPSVLNLMSELMKQNASMMSMMKEQHRDHYEQETWRDEEEQQYDESQHWEEDHQYYGDNGEYYHDYEKEGLPELGELEAFLGFQTPSYRVSNSETSSISTSLRDDSNKENEKGETESSGGLAGLWYILPTSLNIDMVKKTVSLAEGTLGEEDIKITSYNERKVFRPINFDNPLVVDLVSSSKIFKSQKKVKALKRVLFNLVETPIVAGRVNKDLGWKVSENDNTLCCNLSKDTVDILETCALRKNQAIPTIGKTDLKLEGTNDFSSRFFETMDAKILSREESILSGPLEGHTVDPSSSSCKQDVEKRRDLSNLVKAKTVLELAASLSSPEAVKDLNLSQDAQIHLSMISNTLSAGISLLEPSLKLVALRYASVRRSIMKETTSKILTDSVARGLKDETLFAPKLWNDDVRESAVVSARVAYQDRTLHFGTSKTNPSTKNNIPTSFASKSFAVPSTSGTKSTLPGRGAFRRPFGRGHQLGRGYPTGRGFSVSRGYTQNNQFRIPDSNSYQNFRGYNARQPQLSSQRGRSSARSRGHRGGPRGRGGPSNVKPRGRGQATRGSTKGATKLYEDHKSNTDTTFE